MLNSYRDEIAAKVEALVGHLVRVVACSRGGPVMAKIGKLHNEGGPYPYKVKWSVNSTGEYCQFSAEDVDNVVTDHIGPRIMLH